MDIRNFLEQRQPVRLALSCGLDVTARKVEMLDLIAAGQLPAPLLDQALAFQLGEAMRVTTDSLAERLPFLNAVVCAIVIAPRFVASVAGLAPAPEAGPHAYRDGAGLLVYDVNLLPVSARLELFAWAQPEVRPFAEFPGEQSAHGADAEASGATLRAAPQRVPRGKLARPAT